ncbi:MAG: hypothetical protein GF308_09200 [Candidatus Heimdallarchaeota archaeon]|nr:hypothetical protein [Candidatus Heimdallarchaeota archaeon]
MNSLFILLWDELRGFIKSKVMIALWVGLPLLTIIIHLLRPDTEGIPLSIFTGLFISSISGLLGAIMLSTTLVSELNARVYDLFLIRPVKRWHIIIAKYITVMFCLITAALLSLGTSLVIDHFTVGVPPKTALLDVLDSLVMSIAAMSIACVAGILIGILVKSVALAAILSIYLGQQFSTAAILPSIFLENIDPLYFSLGLGVGITAIILTIEIIIFQKKQF